MAWWKNIPSVDIMVLASLVDSDVDRVAEMVAKMADQLSYQMMFSWS